MGRLPELDHDLRRAAGHRLATAKVNRHVLPSPIVQPQLEYCECRRPAVGGHAFLLQGTGVLRPHGVLVDIGNFQPIRVNTDGGALVYDSESSQFLKLKPLVELDIFNFPGKFPGQGVGEVAIETSVIEAELGSRGSALEFTEAWAHPVSQELVLLEERSNTILAYDYTLPASEDNARQIVSSIDMTSNRRDSSGSLGGGVLINNEEPILLKAEEDILKNRLMFDRGRDELISINYDNGTVVIVAKRAAFTDVTGADLADITYIKFTGVEQPDDLQSVRVWDSSSSSLLKVLLEKVLEPTISN